MTPSTSAYCLTAAQNTLALDLKREKYPCFVVNDLSKDERFARLPVVDGTMASYRFYAGTPITTMNGVSIGSFFMFDDRPRPHGLLLQEKKCKNACGTSKVLVLTSHSHPPASSKCHETSGNETRGLRTSTCRSNEHGNCPISGKRLSPRRCANCLSFCLTRLST